MYNIINLQLVCTECPKNMTKEKCPVWQYIAEEPDLFHTSVNESLVTFAKPYGAARGKYEGALMNIFELCNKCREQQK